MHGVKMKFDEIFTRHTLQINLSVLNFNGTSQRLRPLLYFGGSGVDIKRLMCTYVALVNLHFFTYLRALIELGLVHK
jgi:hypothetical protein